MDNDFKPQLLTEASLSSIGNFRADEKYIFEVKYDGQFISVRTTTTAIRYGQSEVNTIPVEDIRYSIRLVNRAGSNLSNSNHGKGMGFLSAAFASLSPLSLAMDGELVRGKFYAFDLPYAEGFVDAKTPFVQRRLVLENLFKIWQPPERIILVPQAVTAGEKFTMVDRAMAEHREGVIAKHKDGLYAPGRRSKSIFKLKFVKEADLVVVECNVKGHSNAVLAAYDGDKLIEVGRVATHHRCSPHVDDIVTVRYLYASESLRLVQPRLVRIRHDKTAEECSIGQLVQTNKVYETV